MNRSSTERGRRSFSARQGRGWWWLAIPAVVVGWLSLGATLDKPTALPEGRALSAELSATMLSSAPGAQRVIHADGSAMKDIAGGSPAETSVSTATAPTTGTSQTTATTLVIVPGSATPGGTTANAASVSPEWAAAVAVRTGIPVRALLGYAGASLAISAEQPGCHLGWTTLAALGSIESAHGTFARSAIGTDGTTRPGILGPSLDGEGFAAIVDTDGGAADSDAAWDRAMGPLQFIPDTWERWGADGNGDGVRDPQQIDDAALAAARYVCSYGDLSVPAAWRSAIFAYNHVESYVDEVASVANSLAARAG